MRTERAILFGLLLCLLAFAGVPCAEGQLDTSQVPVLDTSQVPMPFTVSSEPVKIQTNGPREGLIHLDVAATNREDNPLSGLVAKDFTLTDNGVPQNIVSFAASNQSTDDERLTEVVLVLDEVDLSPVQLGFVKDESIKFLRKNGGHLAQAASVYWFTPAGLYATANPTNDGNALAEDIAHQRSRRELWKGPPNRDRNINALWDRALETVYSIAVERRNKPGRKLLVWIGLGWPASGPLEHRDTAFASLVELSTRMREARLVISQVSSRTYPMSASNFHYADYVVGVRAPWDLKTTAPEDITPHFALPVLAIQSGGLVLDERSDVSRSIERCVEDARVFYTISFDPPVAAQPDEYHDLKIQIGAPGLPARTNTGYYDQPVFYDQTGVHARRVSVHELQQILNTANDKANNEQDGQLAKQLAGLELSERLNSSLLTLWKNRLRGKKSIASLVALADESAFLDPPAAEVLSDPAPNLGTQRQMMLRTVKYLQVAIPKLPDFFAIRTTIRYEQPSPQQADTWKTALPDQSLHEGATEKATLRNRNGQEEQDAAKKKSSPSGRKKDLNFIGVFGPILGAVLVDATRGNSILTWGRWEQGERGKEAVFHYIVRADNPRYDVTYCCLVGGSTFLTSPRYLGELAIDPATGAILRLTMEAELGWIREPDLSPVRPAEASAMMVEYGPVEIGGREYICPQRSVVLMRVRTVRTLTVWDQTFDIYGPSETLLNDSMYADYHKFGSEARMLSGYDVVPDGTATPAVNGQSSTKTPPNR